MADEKESLRDKLERERAERTAQQELKNFARSMGDPMRSPRPTSQKRHEELKRTHNTLESPKVENVANKPTTPEAKPLPVGEEGDTLVSIGGEWVLHKAYEGEGMVVLTMTNKVLAWVETEGCA